MMNLFAIFLVCLVQNSSVIYGATHASNAAITTEGRASSATCIQATLPDVFSIGQCLGSGLDLCTSETQLAQAVRFIGCTLVGSFEDLDAASALNLMRDVYITIAMRRVRNVADFLDVFINGRKAFQPVDQVNCEGEITIGIPNFWSKCLSPDLGGCGNSAQQNTQTVEALAKFGECIATDIYDMASKYDIEKEFCNFINSMQTTSPTAELAKNFFELIFYSKC